MPQVDRWTHYISISQALSSNRCSNHGRQEWENNREYIISWHLLTTRACLDSVVSPCPGSGVHGCHHHVWVAAWQALDPERVQTIRANRQTPLCLAHVHALSLVFTLEKLVLSRFLRAKSLWSIYQNAPAVIKHLVETHRQSWKKIQGQDPCM